MAFPPTAGAAGHHAQIMKQLWAGGPFYTDDPAFKITTDSVLLADFAGSGGSFTRCMDLGCGGGILSVLLYQSHSESVYDSIDLRQSAVDVCRGNYQANHIQGQVFCADLREHRSMGHPGTYDMVVCNPPYFYTGKSSPDGERAAARTGLSPAQFAGAASYLLKKGGTFCVVHKPEFLTDIFAAFRLADIEPKRLQMVSHKIESAPSLVLIAGRRGGRPGLTAHPALVLCNADGSPTQEIRRIYHMQSRS